MVAGTPYYVGSVWYGFDFNNDISNARAAAIIWKDVMTAVHKDLPKKEFEDSEDVVKKGIGYYKKNGKMDNPIYSSSSQKETSSVAESSSAVTPSSETSSTVTSSENTSSTVSPPPETPSSSSEVSTSDTPSSDTSSETPSSETPSDNTTP